MRDLVVYQEEVQQSLEAKKPVVALESTVIAHGLPYPRNLEVALELEDIVRSAGATPATIAIKDGKILVGLTRNDLSALATSKGQALKVSSRDIAYALNKNMLAATTVSATMRIAALAGIAVFATGGIGGVHRDGHISFDISADLMELAKTPVAVVCAGAKSILDLPRTLEYLETLRVPVIGYQTNYFPAFFTHSSGLPLSMSADSPQEIARLITLHHRLIKNGVVIAHPIERSHEIEAMLLETWMKKALSIAHDQGIKGAAITPFVLKYLHEISQGKTLLANITLLKENARLAAHIASAMA